MFPDAMLLLCCLMLRNVVDFNCSVLCTLHCESRITSTATGAVIFGPHGLLFTRIYQHL